MKLKIFLFTFLICKIHNELITPNYRVNRQQIQQKSLQNLEENLKKQNQERQLEMNIEAEENYQEAFENHHEAEHHKSKVGLPTAVAVGSVLAAFQNLRKNKQQMVKKIYFLEQKEKLALQNIILKTNAFDTSINMLKEKMSTIRGSFERFKSQVLKVLHNLQTSSKN